MKEKILQAIDNISSGKKYVIIMYIAILFILFYAYNISFKDYIFPNIVVLALLIILDVVIIFILNIKKIISFYKDKETWKFLLMMLLCVLLVLFRNWNIKNSNYGLPFFTVISILLCTLLAPIKDSQKIIKNIVIFFTIEHVIGTFFCFLFPEIYRMHIMPIFTTSQPELMFEFEHRQIAGITHHYSTNATYLLIGIFVEIFTLSYDIKKDKKKTIVNYVILSCSILALLLTGKRAQVIGGMAVIILFLIIKNKDFIKEYFKKIMISVLAVILVLISVSFVIPTIKEPLMRTINSIKTGDLFETRKPMYNLAIEMFKEKPILGNGWGAFKYYYHENIQIKEKEYMETHNIYLQMFAEIGIIGTAYFLIALGLCFYIQYKYFIKNKNNKFVILSVALFTYYIFIEGLIGNPLYEIPVFIPCMLLMSSSLNYCFSKGEKDE